jgi:diguanylate cyclase (GGDEF)-like protein
MDHLPPIMRHLRQHIWAVLLMLLSLVVPVEAKASDGQAIALQPCIAQILPGDTPEKVWSTPHRFSCNIKQTSLGAGDYWVVLKGGLARANDRQALILLLDWQESIDFNIRYADGKIFTRKVDSGALTQFTRVGGFTQFDLPDRNVAISSILLRLEGAGNISGLVRSAQIGPPEFGHLKERNATALYGIFGGLTLGLLVFNFVIWFSLREKFQLIYCGMVTSMIVYVSSSSVALGVLFPALNFNDQLRISYVALASVAFFGLTFAVNFFEKRIVPYWLKLLASLTARAIMVSGIAFAVFAPQWLTALDRLYLISFVPLPLIPILVMWYGWRRKSQFLRVYFLAWSAPILMILIRLLHAAHFIDFGFIVDHGTMLAMACESLLSSLAMSYRIKLIRSERDVAKAEEAYARRLASVDPLTGLLNRRALLDGAFNSASRQVLTIIDIDHFKKVNDKYGHDKGDEVIRKVAELIQALAPKEARVARLGGEEFALLAPTEVWNSDLVANLVAAIGARHWSDKLRVTASAGSTSGPLTNDAEWQALYRAADAALYQAKTTGRARACFSDEFGLAA